MRLEHGRHLAYCTNVHRAETWAETFANLRRHTLAVRDRVCPGAPFAIGLRLGWQTARELAEPQTLREFRAWLDRENCYVFTINGFPYGRFHGGRVKERVYAPDWTAPERLAYTELLFELLAELVPPGVAGSVSTVPVSFKAFGRDAAQLAAARANLWRCVERIEAIRRRTGRDLHLGLEPEPLCVLETSEETVRFFEQMRADHPGDDRLERCLGMNYDCCHLAIEFEEAAEAIGRLRAAGIRLSKIHLSNALAVRPTPAARAALGAFVDTVYFHQVVARQADGALRRVADLDVALAEPDRGDREWRIHFHIPLHAQPAALFDTTAGHVRAVLDQLADQPQLCSHLEMETYTWEVLPPPLKQKDVVDQLAAEYAWTLAELAQRGVSRSG